MDEQRARINDDLRGVVAGELLFEPLDRASYALGAGPHEIDPLGVVVPRTPEDVVTIVRYASENGIPLHARGAATDPAGGAIGPGLVIDFSRHLRKIVAIADDHVVAEAGVVFDVLNARLAPLGRRLEPSPLHPEAATLGGMIGVDTAGERSCLYGPVSRQVERLRVVFAQGETAELGFEAWPDFDDEPADFKELIVRKLQAIHRHGRARWADRGETSPLNRAGYALAAAANDRGIDLARLICGSEGTLALVLQATLRTTPLPAAQAVVILPFVRLADAAGCVPYLIAGDLKPSACDLYDWRSASLARDVDPLFREHVGDSVESVMLVEFEGDSAAEVDGKARLLIEKAYRTGLMIADAATVHRRADCERLVTLRRRIEPLLMRGRGRARPVPIVDDVAVPVERLSPVIRKLQDLLKRYELSWTLDVYAADGRIRMRPLLDLADPDDRTKIERFAGEFYDVVLEAGGTISSAQGCGLLRTQFLPRQYGELVQVFRDVKDVFDPAYLLNPGKVVGDDPRLAAKNLKRFPDIPRDPEGDLGSLVGSSLGSGSGSGFIRIPEAYDSRETSVVRASDGDAPEAGGSAPASILMPPVLRWPEIDVLSMASACNGCGACRSGDPTLRMCPSFRAHGTEAASPRSQANLLRQVASGQVDPRLWGSAEFMAHADLCIHCKLCKSECPSGVDVSSLILEAKAAFVENHGLPPHDWIFSRLEMWARLASRLPILSNFLMSRRSARWVLERALGLSRRRVLPQVRRTPYTRRAAKLGLNRPRPSQPGPRVIYFVDVYANYYDHELAESVVGVLHQAEVNVYVPTGQRSSGMAPLIVGDVEHARDLALRNLRVLGNAVRDGYTVVCSEPTAALMLRQEYVKLTDDLDAELVARNTMDLGEYLMGLDARGQLPTPHEPVRARVGYHQPCHLRALDVGLPGFDLLHKIPDLGVEYINRGCSGMGGTYGLGTRQFRASLRAGRELHKRLKDDDIEIGSTECGACRIQMEQGIAKRTLHPIKLLSLGYGLNPSLREHFKDPKPRHVMS
ncbi:MAG: FAD-linked oxidase C-terminal domain-containing protein [Paludisphaera borealis]|uniref:FAD-binding and (Fe-S)-binding domain-containing protein n=1 Tax=Paludisphaera borealis TaxID=1387353 RepID=UPI00284992F9|nr:FAD-linked oxidase C-terminal domain-containing protein [Paludisphaera borealis]MDR3621777.1 FAD-linked oxidase C-terminal domain-containing protein [Paludisphaera borealis]